MASKPETTFYESIHRHLPPELHREKMHNPFRGGTFDQWYSGKNKDLWVEYKFIVLPKRPATLVVCNLSKLQLDWGRKRLAEGRNVHVIMGSKEGGVILYPTEWSDSLSAGDFARRTVSRQKIAEWIIHQTGGPL